MERPTNISSEKVNVWEHFSGLYKDLRNTEIDYRAMGSQGSSVGTVSRLQAGRLENLGLISCTA